MSYVICHLCRAKVSCASPSAIPERCPKCEGKIPRDSEVKEDDNAADTAELICPECLGRISLPILQASGHCPICGNDVDEDLAHTLYQHSEAITQAPLQRLLAGEGAGAIASDLQKLGISEDMSWRCVDRIVAELPFERYKREQNGDAAELSPACDACGLSEDLALYDATWELDPNEMKRYRSGYAGFEGQFANSKAYARQAVYCICKRCYKRSGKDDFADGYPRRIGFKLKKIKKRK